MKELKVERVTKTYDLYWEATDGTRFTSEEECRKYEESAHGVLKAKLSDIKVYTTNEDELFSIGCSDNTIYGVKPTTEKHADDILQLYLLGNPHLLRNDEYSKWVVRAEKLIHEALINKDVLLLGECEDGTIYIINTVTNIQNCLAGKFPKPEEEKEEEA